MHHLIGAVVVAFLALFPASVDDGGLNLKAWMAAYEKHLYQQMYDNIENARRNEEICQNSAKNEVLHEQTASEKVAKEPSDAGAGGDLVQHTAEETFEDVEVVEVPVQDGEDTTVEAEAESPPPVYPLYQIDGYIPDEGIQTYLYTRLCEAGIGWFHPYAVCLIAQESDWNPLAVNKNGEDFGLLQYKLRFVPWMDWTNPFQQIDYFVAQMANRAARGLTVSQMISCHMMSDYGEYYQRYVDDVMAHSLTLQRVR